MRTNFLRGLPLITCLLLPVVGWAWSVVPRTDYLSFAKEGKEWICKSGTSSYYSYVIQGDTVVGGETVKKLFLRNESLYHDADLHYFGAVKNDNGKAYILYKDSAEFMLIYDVTLKKGDRFYYNKSTYTGAWSLEGWYSRYADRRRVLKGSGQETVGSDRYVASRYTVIEGVGLVEGLDPFTLGKVVEVNGMTSNFYFLDSCYEDGECVFQWDDASWYSSLDPYVQGGFLPFITEGKTWRCRTADDQYYTYTVSGDTLVNGAVMKKLYLTSEQLYQDVAPHYFGAVREYDDGRTFIVYKDSIAGKCIYDMTLATGDRYFFGDNMRYADYWMEESFTMYSAVRRVLCGVTGSSAESADVVAKPVSIVEGVGFINSDPFVNDSFLSVNGRKTTFCYLESCYEGSELIFSYDESFVTPNISDEIRTVQSSYGQASSLLFDLQGRRITSSQPRSGIYVREGRKFVVK